eukprot:1194487-Prorocentrum_minimum.AAC.1
MLETTKTLTLSTSSDLTMSVICTRSRLVRTRLLAVCDGGGLRAHGEGDGVVVDVRVERGGGDRRGGGGEGH